MARSGKAGAIMAVTTTNDLAKVRRDNARYLLRERCDNKISTFAQTIGRDQPLISAYIGRSPSKRIGDAMARVIETAFDLEAGWLSAPRSEAVGRLFEGGDPKTEVHPLLKLRQGVVTSADQLREIHQAHERLVDAYLAAVRDEVVDRLFWEGYRVLDREVDGLLSSRVDSFLVAGPEADPERAGDGERFEIALARGLDDRRVFHDVNLAIRRLERGREPRRYRSAPVDVFVITPVPVMDRLYFLVCSHSEAAEIGPLGPEALIEVDGAFRLIMRDGEEYDADALVDTFNLAGHKIDPVTS